MKTTASPWKIIQRPWWIAMSIFCTEGGQKLILTSPISYWMLQILTGHDIFSCMLVQGSSNSLSFHAKSLIIQKSIPEADRYLEDQNSCQTDVGYYTKFCEQRNGAFCCFTLPCSLKYESVNFLASSGLILNRLSAAIFSADVFWARLRWLSAHDAQSHM